MWEGGRSLISHYWFDFQMDMGRGKHVGFAAPCNEISAMKGMRAAQEGRVWKDRGKCGEKEGRMEE